MSRPIRVAAQLHPQHGTYAGLRVAVSGAEALGYDVVYDWDHFFPLYGEPDGAHFEAWTTLAAWAEQTDRIELGVLVTCNSYRNPNLLADMARTVDHISGGRLILGVGGGWFRRDYDEYGYPFGTRGERLRSMTGALSTIRARWDRLQPPPTRRIPILIGGAGERITLRAVAEHADAWHAGFPNRPSEMEPKVAALERWCTEIGRDSGEIEWGVGVDPGDLDRFLRQDAEAYRAMGFRQFTLGFNGPAWDVGRGREWLAWRDAANRDRAAA